MSNCSECNSKPMNINLTLGGGACSYETSNLEYASCREQWCVFGNACECRAINSGPASLQGYINGILGEEMGGVCSLVTETR